MLQKHCTRFSKHLAHDSIKIFSPKHRKFLFPEMRLNFLNARGCVSHQAILTRKIYLTENRKYQSRVKHSAFLFPSENLKTQCA
jgi:hypothetical protein